MDRVEAYIDSLLKKSITPGISLLVARSDQVLLQKHFGHQSLLPSPIPLAHNTIYDLASLTKPLITALLAVIITEKYQIPLSTPIHHFLPGLHTTPGNEITLHHLLTHTSGLPAWYPLYLYRTDYISLIRTLPLESLPGASVNYSCVGYILLHFILEKIAGSSFYQLTQDLIIQPLGLTRTFLKVPDTLKAETAPTENGNCFERSMAEKWAGQAANKKVSETRHQQIQQFPWRDYLIQGETHDINSFMLNGCAGNAGLFSTCEEVLHLALQFFPASTTLLKPESTGLFWKNFTPWKKSHRTIGFKRNSSLITCGGRALPRSAIGHSGFTGTSLWLNLQNHTTLIILSNRIHPTVTDYNFNKPRRKLHQLLLRALKID